VTRVTPRDSEPSTRGNFTIQPDVGAMAAKLSSAIALHIFNRFQTVIVSNLRNPLIRALPPTPLARDLGSFASRHEVDNRSVRRARRGISSVNMVKFSKGGKRYLTSCVGDRIPLFRPILACQGPVVCAFCFILLALCITFSTRGTNLGSHIALNISTMYATRVMADGLMEEAILLESQHSEPCTPRAR
jgi:hypothetical protein